MAELERPELLAIARANVIRLRFKKNLRWKEIAKLADVSETTLNNLSRGKPVSDLVLARVAEVLGTDLEHLFYNTPDENATPAAGADEEAKARALREIDELLSQLDDPEDLAAAANVILSALRAYNDNVERKRAGPPGARKSGPGAAAGGAGRAKGAEG